MNDETSWLIKLFKRDNLCLSFEDDGDQENGIHDFTDCFPHLGESDALIFCVPGRKADDIHNLVLNKHGGVFHGIRIYIIDEYCVQAKALFPAWPEWIDSENRPTEDNFWGHYSKVEIVEAGEKRRPLDVLHLGIGQEAVGPFFFQPHGIKVSTIICNPPYDKSIAANL